VHTTYFVPVHSTASAQEGTLALRTGRLLSGERIGLAFTCEASLLSTLGSCQEWIRLDEEALFDMLMPLGVEHIRVDPRPAAELRARSGGPLDCPGLNGRAPNGSAGLLGAQFGPQASRMPSGASHGWAVRLLHSAAAACEGRTPSPGSPAGSDPPCPGSRGRAPPLRR
jgi:hypothetical protein